MVSLIKRRKSRKQKAALLAARTGRGAAGAVRGSAGAAAKGAGTVWLVAKARKPVRFAAGAALVSGAAVLVGKKLRSDGEAPAGSAPHQPGPTGEVPPATLSGAEAGAGDEPRFTSNGSRPVESAPPSATP